MVALPSVSLRWPSLPVMVFTSIIFSSWGSSSTWTTVRKLSNPLVGFQFHPTGPFTGRSSAIFSSAASKITQWRVNMST